MVETANPRGVTIGLFSRSLGGTDGSHRLTLCRPGRAPGDSRGLPDLAGNAKPSQQIRTFGTMLADLEALRDWLKANDCTLVAMEEARRAIGNTESHMLLAESLTEQVIGLAIEVHRNTGPGLLEAV